MGSLYNFLYILEDKSGAEVDAEPDGKICSLNCAGNYSSGDDNGIL
jgi:hypothetical protein